VSAGCPAGHLRVLLDGLSVFQQYGLLLVAERAASGNGAAGAPMTGMGNVLDIARVRQREALPRLLRQFAAQTGQMLNISKAGQAVGLESSTAWAVVFLNVAGFRHVLRRDGQRRELDTGGGAAGAVGSRRR